MTADPHHAADAAFAAQANAPSRQAPQGGPLSWGVVQAVITGPPKKVTVTVNGSTNTTSCRYIEWYTPTVGDVVALIQDGKGLFCLGTRA